MTMTSLVIALFDPIYLVIGLALLNAIFRPPYCDTMDFFAMIICVLYLFMLASWGMMLNYGLEVL